MDMSRAIKMEHIIDDEDVMDFSNREEYENYSSFASIIPNTNNDSSLDVCGLCGAVGKLFTKIKENSELVSKIQKHMSFVDVQNHFSDCICYQCLSHINSWHGFYLNCSLVKSKFSRESEYSATDKTKSKRKEENVSYANSMNHIMDSFSRLECNPNVGNMTQTMTLLTDCLKTLIDQVKTHSSNSDDDEELVFLDDSIDNEDTFDCLRPSDVIQVDLAETYVEQKTKTKMNQIREVKSNHGRLFYDNDGYAYRINKKQPGKLYVRCAVYKCPVRGSIVGNSFRTNKHKHIHPPCHGENGKLRLTE